MKIGISAKIFLIVSLGILSGAGLFIFYMLHSYNSRLSSTAADSLERTEKEFHSILSNETQKLSLALDYIEEDKTANRLFYKKQKDALYQYSLAKFKKIRRKYHITHQYYINPAPLSTCFLRVHNPSVAGDTIKRFTYKNSQEKKGFASGLELGKTAFALRAVKPIKLNDSLIGYAEVGEEIDHFFEHLKKQTGDEFMLLVNKKYLNRDDWESARKLNKKITGWNRFKKKVVINQTAQTGDFLKSGVPDIPEKSTVSNSHYFVGDKVFVVGAFPVNDAGNRKVGAVYFAHDISNLYSEFVRNIKIMGLVFLVLSAIFGVFSYFYIKRTITLPINRVVDVLHKVSEKKIGLYIANKRKDEIGKLYESGNLINKNFSQIIGHINRNADEIMQTGIKAREFSHKISQNSAEQASATEEISASLEGISQNISENSEAAQLSLKKTEHITRDIQDVQSAFKKSLEAMQNIDDKTEMINEIAFKTNLLALNASIVASKARGSSRKGFMVVAGEVKKLAEQSKKTAHNIEQLVSTNLSIGIEANKVLNSALPNIKSTIELTDQISRGTIEQSKNVNQINKSVQEMVNTANSGTSDAEGMEEQANILSDKAKNLQGLIRDFEDLSDKTT